MNIWNEANKINKRIEKLVNEVGADTAALKQYGAYLDTAFKGHVDMSKGYPQIKRGKDLETLKNPAFKFDQLSKMPTFRDVKAKARKQLKEQGVNRPTNEDIKNQITLSDNAEQIINDNAYKYDTYKDIELEWAKKTLHKKGERKSWEEINRICEILQKDYTERSIKEPENEFGMTDGVHR